MGHGRWSSADWRNWSGRNTAGRSTAEIFTSVGLLPDYDPARIRMRESRDGPDNAASTPIVLASDVTGSLARGILTAYAASPVVWIAILVAMRHLARDEASLLARARAAGEPI